MALIDETYFIGIIDIPNLTTTTMGTNNHDRKDEVLRYINIYEAEFLRTLLGNLYSDFTTNATTKWDDLKDLLCDSINHVSPIANYVFFKCYPTMCARNTTSGVAFTTVENQTIDNSARMVAVWNEMIYKMYEYDGVLDYLYQNGDSLATEDYQLPTYILNYPSSWTPFNFVNAFGI